jgi:hypothetical protein
MVKAQFAEIFIDMAESNGRIIIVQYKEHAEFPIFMEGRHEAGTGGSGGGDGAGP